VSRTHATGVTLIPVAFISVGVTAIRIVGRASGRVVVIIRIVFSTPGIPAIVGLTPIVVIFCKNVILVIVFFWLFIILASR
jgi:hypothetical protein